MKLNQLTPAMLLIAILLTTSLSAQVTIGSTQPPAAGALLDLKQDGTTTRGMMLPRVKLADIDALTMGTNVIPNANDAWEKHAGLVVYNISGEAIPKCAPIPDGLYVWDGAKWNVINTPTPVDPASLDVGTKSTFYLPSGRDLRPLTAQSFTATWSPSTLPYTKTNHATFGGLSFSGANALPVSPLAASPVVFNLLPDAMTPAEITANPFHTKESTLTFDVTDECGDVVSKTITINQTNKALTIDGSSTPPTITTTTSMDLKYTLQSNVKWQVSATPNNSRSVFSVIKLNSKPLLFPGTPIDWEQHNNAGQGATNNLNGSFMLSSTKTRYSKLTFSDTENPKRFADVNLSILICNSIIYTGPKMSEWADIAGFADVAETKTSDADDTAKQIDTPNTTTGIAWHRDQDGNIFLSSSFDPTDITGDTERWMITNLAARNYSTNVTHGATPARALSGPNGNAGRPYNTAYWAYPSDTPKAAPSQAKMDPTNPLRYDNNPHLGLLYTWDAAAAGKGGTTGEADITDGAIDHPKVQGVCPDGWYLPSDYDYTVLENKILYRTSLFSGTANISSGNANYLPQGAPYNWRENLSHGKAMKEACEPYTLIAYLGTSNPIGTTKRPGFNALLTGEASYGSAQQYGEAGAMWTASGGGTDFSHFRAFFYNLSRVNTGLISRHYLLPVRCKKN